MTFRTFHTARLILISLLVRGLLPFEQRAGTRSTSPVNRGYFHRDLPARRSNDVPSDETSGHNVFERPAVQSESEFVSYCESWFLSSQKDISKAFVSQGDLVDFLVETCHIFDEEDVPEFDCPAPTFTSIAVDVQLVFVKHLCNVKVGEEMVKCLKSIVEAGNEFGYGVDLTKSPFAEELCCGLLPFLELVGLEQNSDCPQIPNGVPASHSPTSSPESSGQITSSPIGWSGQTPSPAPSTFAESEFSAAPSSIRMESTSVPTIKSNLPPPSRATPSPTKTQGPASNSAGSPAPVAGGTIVPTETPGPTAVNTPSEAGSPVVFNEGVNDNTSPDNTVSAGKIAGVALGLGGLCIMGIVTSRRRARKQEEAELSDTTPEESSSD